MPLYLFDKGKCCLYVFHVFNGDYAPSVTLSNLAIKATCRYIAHYSSKGVAGIVTFITGINKKEVHSATFEIYLFHTQTDHTLLFFTDKGRVYIKKGYNIPEAGRNARGSNIVNIIQIENIGIESEELLERRKKAQEKRQKNKNEEINNFSSFGKFIIISLFIPVFPFHYAFSF